MKRGRKAITIGLFIASGLIAVGACSNYGEGERCDFANNNDDCSAGLVCVRKQELAETPQLADRCCPVDRKNATHPACIIGVAITEAGAPADTGPPPPPVTAEAGIPDASDGSSPADAADAGDGD